MVHQVLQNLHGLADSPAQKITLVAAGAATVSPWWLDLLEHVNPIFEALLPMAGVAWFVTQIILAILKYRQSRS